MSGLVQTPRADNQIIVAGHHNAGQGLLEANAFTANALTRIEQLPVVPRITLLRQENSKGSIILTVSREFPQTSFKIATVAAAIGSCARVLGLSRVGAIFSCTGGAAVACSLVTLHLRSQQDLTMTRGELVVARGEAVVATEQLRVATEHLRHEHRERPSLEQPPLRRQDSQDSQDSSETNFTAVVESPAVAERRL